MKMRRERLSISRLQTLKTLGAMYARFVTRLQRGFKLSASELARREPLAGWLQAESYGGLRVCHAASLEKMLLTGRRQTGDLVITARAEAVVGLR
ncbi:hypothetical protein MES5069_310099 [Mesorhizobium escarrei]|uniref:Transposase n=1 Tax=Mesorhizobium escarrei TaxID=666018 RepID=A0ABN8JZA7_9HYPH|nr:hypothetical protein MES5069_310099 [Mesorhizobium escarrei]